MKRVVKCLMIVCCLSLSACSMRTWYGGLFYSAEQHVVRRGETLYSIAFHYDKDYRRLALINHLRPPYTVYVGQVLRLKTVKWTPAPAAKHYTPPHRAYKSVPIKPIAHLGERWVWPSRGSVVATFAPEYGRKGIDIAGHHGQPVLAAASGVVAYAGQGLAGYGNLIIIKHNAGRLTAYGYNSRNIVYEGQQVRAGQKIAEMGQVNHRFWGVHFEVREAGRPVNPLRYVRAS